MPVNLEWREIAPRLILTILAGGLIGFNRGEHGRPAGLRTTLLVCLAASISMIQANLLLNTVGKDSNSFIVLDLMRLPLGILSGMGFIGAGAIMRKSDRVVGITTAATLWFVTVMGLCFGGGQIKLGLAALGLAMTVLTYLKWIEQRMHQDQHAILQLTLRNEGPDEQEIRKMILADQFRITSYSACFDLADQQRKIELEIWWCAPNGETGVPPFLDRLLHSPGVVEIQWRPGVPAGGSPFN